MFMRLRGGGVGHLGTLYLDSGLKKDRHESCDEQQVKVTFTAMHEDTNSYPHEEQDDSAEEDPRTCEEHTSRREHSNEEDKEDEDKDADSDQEASGNINDE